MWGELDVASSVDLSTVARYSMEALEQWFRHSIGLDWYQLHVERGVGVPFVRTEIEFQRPVRPRDALAVAVTVEKVGRSSVVFQVSGHAEGRNERCWQGRFTCVFANAKTGESTPVPEAYRAIIEASVSRARDTTPSAPP
jgi:acyl-CoA thioesterase FadM